ncbi:VID27 cytoplasmic protein [Punctularia strigosozonata HHB-11173 SS5]|uniref:VID27 cytoplasmic protein n=1 Tax=Punctularia strigosozonata (strain HHB-11173) TaxID=741275 RepID=UPI0004417447|nr:VID27 cytoplasmic protein [Punctularia strigosozonata HHB-11173 SS5]EIN10470.1 VID27 cytoplasmic protein [Punctularia strigosozonata HHB-11173 SS5]
MNIFRTLMGKVWHDPNAAEVVKISTGQLYLVRPENIRSSRECIYNDAMATVRRVPQHPHAFSLVITRVYEEGDQELLEDEDETDEERTFLIGEELCFRTGKTPEGEPTLIWRDLEGDIDETYEFVATGTNEPTVAFFETCMYRAMYERKYQTSADNTTDADLQEFTWQPPAKKRVAAKARSASGSAAAATSAGPAPPVAPPATRPKVESAADALPTLVDESAELWLWEPDNEQYSKYADVTVRIVSKPEAPFAYYLVATSADGDVLMHAITTDMSERYSAKMLSFTWCHLSERGGASSSWCLRFEGEGSFENFMDAFTKAKWETLNQVPWGKIKEDEQQYVKRANLDEDVIMADPEDDEDEEEDVANELDPDLEASDEEEEEEEEDADAPKLPKGERNSQLTVGYKGDRSYVSRGGKIGVFRYDEDGHVKYQSTLNKLATPKGKEFDPKRMMLHDQDTTMVIMNPLEPHALYSMDIERGKIVEEWKVHDDITVDHMAPDNKFAQMTTEQTLVGASGNALFRIDPRVSGNKMVDSQYKQYAGKNKFSGVTTTASGKLAVASEKGDIRLFDTIGKNAKTALPPLGDPILGIDVTADGRWIVATTKTYLLLIDTLIGEGRYAGQLGFDRSFPATAKPIPRRLQLRPEHVAYMGNEVSFTSARFNVGEGQTENAIVTSTGQYIVAWDFNKVKKGQLDKYEIKKYEDLVVQDSFRFGDDKEIIVALQNNVLNINRKNLKRPTRASLAPGPRISRSGIVNSPY